MKLTICGTPGAGKGTVSKILAKELHLERLSAGDLFREEAEKRHMKLLDFLEWCNSNPGFDKIVDEKQRKLGGTKENFIFDGRTSFLFIPDATHIYLSAGWDEAARHVSGDTHRKSEGVSGLSATKTELIKRYDAEVKRYMELYNVNVHDPANFDIVVDTTGMTIQESAQAILSALKKRDTTGKEQ